MKWQRLGRTFALTLCVVATPPQVEAEGAPSGGGLSSGPALSPREKAIELYENGLKARDKAWKLEEKLDRAKPSERAKLRKKADKLWERSIRKYERAVALHDELFQAHGSLGYALRRTGRYEASLAAYDRALEIEPGYAEAIEYRGEAYLALGRIDDAKEAYLTLYRGGSEKAGTLRDAIEQWVAEHRDRGPHAATADELATWLDERARLERRVGAVASSSAW